MTKTLLIAFFACFAAFSFAQPINPWPTENAWWEIRYFDDFGNPTISERLRNVDGDTLIQGMTYQKIWEWGNYAAATRSDSLGRVYVVPKDSSSEVLLYDFSAQVGDTLFGVQMGAFGQGMGTTAVVVEQKDTVMLLDGPHLRMSVSDTAFYPFGIELYDGVGAMNDFLYPMYWPSVSGWDQLVCMNRDFVPVVTGQCLVLGASESMEMAVEAFPNPSSSRVRVEFPSPELIVRAVLLDARGTLVRQWDFLPNEIELGTLPAGIYLLQVSGDDLHETIKLLRQ